MEGWREIDRGVGVVVRTRSESFFGSWRVRLWEDFEGLF